MLCDRLSLSERRACQIAGQHRSTQRHEPRQGEDDAALRSRLREISRERPRWGYRRAHARLLEGITASRASVLRAAPGQCPAVDRLLERYRPLLRYAKLQPEFLPTRRCAPRAPESGPV